MSVHLDTIPPWRQRQTDRQMELLKRYLALHA